MDLIRVLHHSKAQEEPLCSFWVGSLKYLRLGQDLESPGDFCPDPDLIIVKMLKVVGKVRKMWSMKVLYFAFSGWVTVIALQKQLWMAQRRLYDDLLSCTSCDRNDCRVLFPVCRLKWGRCRFLSNWAMRGRMVATAMLTSISTFLSRRPLRRIRAVQREALMQNLRKDYQCQDSDHILQALVVEQPVHQRSDDICHWYSEVSVVLDEKWFGNFFFSLDSFFMRWDNWSLSMRPPWPVRKSSARHVRRYWTLQIWVPN